MQNTYYCGNLVVLCSATKAAAVGLDYRRKLERRKCCIKITTIVRQNCRYLFLRFICFSLNRAWDAVT